MTSTQDGDRFDVQHFLLCRVFSMGPSLRSGPERADPGRVGHHLMRVLPDRVKTIDLRPAELRTLLVSNVEAYGSDQFNHSVAHVARTFPHAVFD